MSAIGKGDWVQLVKANPGSDPAAWGMRLGGVYCVECTIPPLGACRICGFDGPGIDLVGVAKVPGCGFCPCQFAPLGGNAKTRTLKAPPINAPARVSEDA